MPKEGITLTGLIDGQYRLTEVSAPAGYVITESEPVSFTVSGGAITNTEGTIGDVRYTAATGEKDAEFIIPNEPGAALPYTGGPGTAVLYLFGMLLVGAAVAGLVHKLQQTH